MPTALQGPALSAALCQAPAAGAGRSRRDRHAARGQLDWVGRRRRPAGRFRPTSAARLKLMEARAEAKVLDELVSSKFVRAMRKAA